MLTPGLYLIHAHVALFDNIVVRVKLRCAKGTSRFTSTATNAECGVNIDNAILFTFEDGSGGTGRQTGGFAAMVAGHVDLVCKNIRVGTTLNILHTSETRASSQAIFIFTAISQARQPIQSTLLWIKPNCFSGLTGV